MHATGMALDLDPRDVVTFPFCSYSSGTVRDLLRGEALDVNQVGAYVVGRCDGQRSWAQVVADVASRYGIPHQEASADLYAFVEDADARALLRVHRCKRARLRADALVGRLLDLAFLRVARLERRRYRPTAGGCLRATLYACRLALTLGLAVVPFIAAMLLQQAQMPVGTAVLGALLPLTIAVFVVLTILGHELAHLLALPSAVRARADVCARNLVVLVRYPTPLNAADVKLVAVVGPVAGLLMGLLAAALLWYAGAGFGLPYLAAGVGVAHLASLTPWSTDGRALFSAAADDHA